MLSVITLSVVMLSVIMLSVVALSFYFTNLDIIYSNVCSKFNQFCMLSLNPYNFKRIFVATKLNVV
jgi:hypothetical protein